MPCETKRIATTGSKFNTFECSVAIQISVSGSDVLRLHCPKSRIVKYPQRNVEPCSCQREISLYNGMRQGAAAGKVSQEAGGVIPVSYTHLTLPTKA